MQESDLNTDPQRVAAEGKRPWVTPRIIVSESASLTEAVPFTTPGIADHHGAGTTAFAS
jgi:hypothetical protein